MRTCTMMTAATLVVAVALTPVTAEPIGTAFTYQGQLKLDDGPVNGTVDFCFKLYDATIGGSQVGDTLCFDGQGENPPPIPVENGQFTVKLDFGAALNGESRWLGVEVRSPSGAGDYTALSPHQEITPTPYALQTRGLHVDEDGSLDVAGQVRLNNEWQAMVLAGDPSQSQWSEIVWHALGAADPNRFGIGVDQTGLFFSRRNSDNTSVGTTMFLKQNGNVGIGTMSPEARVHIADTGNAFLRLDSGPGLLSEIDHFNGGVAGSAIKLFPASDTRGVGFYTGGDFTNANAKVMIETAGNVGIGTTDPPEKLTVVGGSIYAAGSGNGSGFLLPHHSIREDDDGSERLRITNNSDNDVVFMLGEGNVGIGTPNPTARLHVNGTAKVNVIQITGADLAERFPTSEKLEPGMVVEIDPDQSGTLRASRSAYNQRVAGIVSGANGLSVGAVLGNLTGENDGPPIALAGRVWCWCDASNGAIRPGDRLTTSPSKGHAMRVTDNSRAPGAVLGKAMTNLEEGQGLVLVMVSLQ